MFPVHKHSYLQLHCKRIHPPILNRVVELALSKTPIPDFDVHDLKPGFNRLTSEQPHIACQQVDVSRRREGFGRCALPKLRLEIQSNNHTTVLRALHTIADLAHDPEKNSEAIKLKIPIRIAYHLLHTDDNIREMAIICLTIIAGIFDGKMAISQSEYVLRQIEYVLNDGVAIIRYKTAILLKTIAEVWMAGDYLVQAGYVEKLLERLKPETDDNRIVILEALKKLLYEEGILIALDNEAFSTFGWLLKTSKNDIIIERTLACMMMLVTTKPGKRLALENQLVPKIYHFLTHHNLDIVTGAMGILSLATISTRAKVEAADNIPDLARKVVKYIHNPCQETLQIYAMKTLINIIEEPRFRKYVYEKYYHQILNLQTNLAPHHKEQLITTLDNVTWQQTWPEIKKKKY